MSVVLTDTFTGTNGDPWDTSKWETLATGGGGTKTATIQSNRGRLAVASANNNAYIMKRALITDAQDVEVRGLVVQSASVTGSPRGWMAVLRANSAYIHPNDLDGDGYYIVRGGTNNTVTLFRRDETNGQDSLGSFTGPDRKSDCRYRFQIISDDIKVKFWLASGSEPSTWDLEVTNSDVTAAGRVILTCEGSLNSNTWHEDNDDVEIEDFNAGAPPLPTSGSGWGIPVGI